MSSRIIRRKDRRRFLALSAGAVVAPFVLSHESRSETRTLYVNSWGGSWTKAQDAAYYKPYTAATGVRVRVVEPVSYSKLKVQVESGNYEWDVTTFNKPDWLRADQEGLAEPIDWTAIHREKLYPDADFANGINHTVTSVNVVYRKDKFPKGGPQSWADFWDVKRFPGTRAMYRTSGRCLVMALLADGVPRDKLFPADLDRAFRKLAEIKPHIKVWWTQNTQSQQLIRDGEVDMIAMTNARALELMQQNVPIELVWNDAVLYEGVWGVAKGAPNRKLAWEFVEFSSQAERQADFCKRLWYGPTNPDAFKYIPEDIARHLPTYPANLAVAAKSDFRWLGKHLSEIEERFNALLVS